MPTSRRDQASPTPSGQDGSSVASPTTGSPGSRGPAQPTAGRRSAGVALRRGIGYLLATVVVPGSVQLVAGNQRVGRIALRIWAGLWGLVILTGLTLLVWRGAALTILGNGWTWKLAAVAVIALSLGWCALLVDAWRLSQPLHMTRRGRLGFGLVALVLSVAMLVAGIGVGRAANANGNLLRSVLAGGGDAQEEAGRINILLLGGDAGADRTGLRPDSLTVASVDARTGRTVLFSLPRNLEGAPFPKSSPLHQLYPNGYDCEDHSCMLNAVYTLGQQHKDLYPGVKDPGVQATREAVSELLGLKINYYAMIDLAGFQQLIDAMGGIRLDIAKRVPIGGGTWPIVGWIEPGKNVKLNGYKALWFARSREGSSDYERMLRQKCVMNAMLNQLNPATVVLKFQDIAKAGGKIAQTDVGSGDLDTLISLATKAKSKPIGSVAFTPPLIYPGNPKLDVIRQTVASKIAASQAKDQPKTSASPTKTSPKPTTAHPTGTTPSGTSTAGSPSPSSSASSSTTDDLSSVCTAR